MTPEQIEKLAEQAAKRTCWSTDSPQRVFQYGWECGFIEGQRTAPSARAPLRKHQVEWVVNERAELGVKIGDQLFFLYKGRSYQGGTKWRHVFKREFGECCHPEGMQIIPSDYSRAEEGWQPIPPPKLDSEYRCQTHSWVTCHGSTYCRDCDVDQAETKCKDCGVPTTPGPGSARCPGCWEDRCGQGGA